MLRVFLRRLEAKAEELLAEEQAGFRPGLSTVQQIFNSRVIIEKHLQHQREVFHNFIDFKKAFDRVWHAGLWQVLRSFNLEEGSFNFKPLGHYMRTRQCGPLEQTAKGVLQDKSRRPLGMLSLTHPLKLVPREDHAGNTPWPPHIHLHW